MESASRLHAVIFDLDGTLIDSAPSILESFRLVLDEAGLMPQVPLNAALIGPPLRQTLAKITGLAAGAQLEELAASFQRIYDSDGYRATRVYPGVEALLAALAASGIALAIATNKRRTPTLKILQHFGWERYFRLVGTLDTPIPPHADKAALIRTLLDELGTTAPSSLYLGDKLEDGEAAAANAIPFLAAAWGYGDWSSTPMPQGWGVAQNPEAAQKLISAQLERTAGGDA